MVALVGRSGGGKSTLAALIRVSTHRQVGEILLDEVEIEDYRLRSLRRHVAQVTQHVTLFNDLVANNIAYGDLAGAPREAVKKRVDAYAMDFIAELPKGLDTEVSAKTACCSPAVSASVWRLPVPC